MSSPLLSTPRSTSTPARCKIVGGIVAAALALAVPTAAGAATPNLRSTASSLAAQGLATVAQRCEDAITTRQGQIDKLSGQISAAQAWSSPRTPRRCG